MNWFIAALKNYAVFEGRACRQEFWCFLLFTFGIGFFLGIVGTALHTKLLGNIFSLLVFIPTLAVTVRRLHDIGLSGRYFAVFWLLNFVLALLGVFLSKQGVVFVGYLPLIISFVAFHVLMAKDSQKGDNKYGANPKAVPAPVDNGQQSL